MFFSVVIPTFERPEDLYQALDALSPKRQTYPKAFQVIVSDDSNDQRSKKMIEEEFRGVTWTQGKKNGPAGNRNSGAKISKGDWLIFIDDDCIPEPTFIQSYEQAIIKNSYTSVFEGRIFPTVKERHGLRAALKTALEECYGLAIYVSKKVYLRTWEVLMKDFGLLTRMSSSHTGSNRIKLNLYLFLRQLCVIHGAHLEGGEKIGKQRDTKLSRFCFFGKARRCSKRVCNPNLYLKNFLRIMSKTLLYCLFSLRGRGIDVLFAEAFVSLQTSIILTFNIKK